MNCIVTSSNSATCCALLGRASHVSGLEKYALYVVSRTEWACSIPMISSSRAASTSNAVRGFHAGRLRRDAVYRADGVPEIYYCCVHDMFLLKLLLWRPAVCLVGLFLIIIYTNILCISIDKIHKHSVYNLVISYT